MSDQADELTDRNQGRRPEGEVAVGQMVARLFEHWRLTASDQAALLGQLAQVAPQQAVGDAVASNETAERIANLLAIHARLRTLFPQNRDLAYAWMSTANLAFDSQAPVTVVREHGLEGLRGVRAYLERAMGV